MLTIAKICGKKNDDRGIGTVDEWREVAERELKLRGYSFRTRKVYLYYMEQSVRHYKRDPRELGDLEIKLMQRNRVLPELQINPACRQAGKYFGLFPYMGG